MGDVVRLIAMVHVSLALGMLYECGAVLHSARVGHETPTTTTTTEQVLQNNLRRCKMLRI